MCVNPFCAPQCFSSKAHESTLTSVSPRPALRNSRNSLRLDKAVKFSIEDVTPHTVPPSHPARDDKTKGN